MNNREAQLEAVLSVLLEASYDHMASNGDAPIGRDQRQRVTPSMIFADHAMLDAMAVAREVLGVTVTHDALILAARRRNFERARERFGDMALQLKEFADFKPEGPLFADKQDGG